MFFANWGHRDHFFQHFSELAVFSYFLLRFGSIFGGPDPQKVTTLTGISHFFDFLKNRKKWPTGTPKWTPNGQELAKEIPKITKMAKKTIILRGRFFDEFWVAKKIEKRGHDHL